MLGIKSNLFALLGGRGASPEPVPEPVALPQRVRVTGEMLHGIVDVLPTGDLVYAFVEEPGGGYHSYSYTDTDLGLTWLLYSDGDTDITEWRLAVETGGPEPMIWAKIGSDVYGEYVPFSEGVTGTAIVGPVPSDLKEDRQLLQLSGLTPGRLLGHDGSLIDSDLW